MTVPVHLISDSTGETISKIADAAFALFPVGAVDRREHFLVLTEAEADRALARVTAAPGPVLITMTDPHLRRRITDAATAAGAPTEAVLAPVIALLERTLGRKAAINAGGQHRIDSDYFKRMEAIDYTLRNDDGALADRVEAADVVLTGVSRTSKTPTCVYLAVKGLKAANVPLLPHAPPPPELLAAAESGTLIVALTASPARLAQIRAERLDSLGGDVADDYAALEAIRHEVASARLVFERLGAPVIDVTRRSIEETAAAVVALHRNRNAA